MDAGGGYFSARVGAFYGAQFLIYGATLPYLSVMLAGRGLSAAEIGVVSAVPLAIRLFLTPAVAIRADRDGSHRGMVIGLAAVAFASTVGVSMARGFWPLLVTVGAFQAAMQSMMPLVETIAMSGARRWGCDYGRMRLVGSVTFILATFVGASLIERYGADVIAWVLVTVCGATLAVALALPATGADEDAVPRRNWRPSAAVALFASRPMMLFLLATGAVQSAHAVFYGFGVLQWRATGVPAGWIGSLWSIGVIAEIALFWWSGAVLARLAAPTLILLGAGAAVVRWTAMAFDPPLALLVPLQVLHGLTYGATHLGAMHFIKAATPDGQAGTAQAMYSTISAGIGMGAAMVIAGVAYDRFGGFAYLTMSVLAVVGFVAAIGLRRSWQVS